VLFRSADSLEGPATTMMISACLLRRPFTAGSRVLIYRDMRRGWVEAMTLDPGEHSMALDEHNMSWAPEEGPLGHDRSDPLDFGGAISGPTASTLSQATVAPNGIPKNKGPKKSDGSGLDCWLLVAILEVPPTVNATCRCGGTFISDSRFCHQCGSSREPVSVKYADQANSPRQSTQEWFPSHLVRPHPENYDVWEREAQVARSRRSSMAEVDESEEQPSRATQEPRTSPTDSSALSTPPLWQHERLKNEIEPREVDAGPGATTIFQKFCCMSSEPRQTWS